MEKNTLRMQGLRYLDTKLCPFLMVYFYVEECESALIKGCSEIMFNSFKVV